MYSSCKKILEGLCDPGLESHPAEGQGCEQTKSQQFDPISLPSITLPHMCTKGPLILQGSQERFLPDLQTQDPNAIKCAGAGVAWTGARPLSSVGKEMSPGRSNTVAGAAHRDLYQITVILDRFLF